MTTTFAVITDLHYSRQPVSESRKGEWANVLLLRAVHRLRRHIKPDAVILLGDLLNDPLDPDADDLLADLRRTLDLLPCPYLALRGNHDPPADRFYRIMPRPADFADLAGVRFVAFDDPEEPGYNAVRLPHDLQRMTDARRSWAGTIVTLQHVAVLPPGSTDCPYTYTNIGDVLDRTRRAGIALSIGGHYHAGRPPVRDGQQTYLCSPGLAESPFPITLVCVNRDGVEIKVQPLAMPADLGLFDAHAHSQFAWCCENVSMDASTAMADLMGLAGLAFTEHVGHLYFDRQIIERGGFAAEGIDTAICRSTLIEQYWTEAALRRRPGLLFGLEIDTDYKCRPILRPEDRGRADLLLGSIHGLAEDRAARPDAGRLGDQFLASVESLCRAGVHVIAHPFRTLKGAPHQSLYDPFIRLVKRYGAAVEINFHHFDPDPTLIRRCIDAGLKLTFGSDAHNLSAVGEFYPHLRLLRQAGYNGSLADVLARF